MLYQPIGHPEATFNNLKAANVGTFIPRLTPTHLNHDSVNFTSRRTFKPVNFHNWKVCNLAASVGQVWCPEICLNHFQRDEFHSAKARPPAKPGEGFLFCYFLVLVRRTT